MAKEKIDKDAELLLSKKETTTNIPTKNTNSKDIDSVVTGDPEKIKKARTK